ncbi:APC family permease [Anaerovorax odorimutans]|uniref:APC family permease n=1 Tax=Anaerovorax odorimutans TaxID=109327 RepID=UPI00041819F5|nr:APC family permease [Anaerovorax odorimutans]
MERQKRGYSLFTAIAMIVGIVIGSGIFFKADNMLVATNGNVGLAVIMFCIAAFSIVFGSLTFSQFASLTDKPGGIITYANEFVGKRFACALGWFQTYVYYPTLTIVLSWVVGIYTGVMFGWDLSLAGQIYIGFIWYIICFGYNMISAKLAGIFQEIAMLIKLIPLIGIAVSGIMFGDPVGAIMNPTPEAIEATKNLAWISAIGPVAFSFDGWIISTAVAHEVKNAKRNMPRALIAAPLFVLAVYILYFVGICGYIGPEKVMELEDASVSLLADKLFGTGFAAMIMVFIVISVMGTTNGIILGYIRVPYSLGIRNMIPGSRFVSRVNHNTNVPFNSACYCFVIGVIWWVIHFITQKYGFLPNSDISEIAIVMNYLLYIVLYYAAYKMWRIGRIRGVGAGFVYPLLATVGSLTILFGGLQNPNFFAYIAISLIVIIVGFFYGSNARMSI